VKEKVERGARSRTILRRLGILDLGFLCRVFADVRRHRSTAAAYFRWQLEVAGGAKSGLCSELEVAYDVEALWSLTKYYFRQLRDMKMKIDVESTPKADSFEYVELCGWALACAHCWLPWKRRRVRRSR
jgi:Uncharacterized protein conserved in bacteria (DUF2252)